MYRRPPRSTLFPYTRSSDLGALTAGRVVEVRVRLQQQELPLGPRAHVGERERAVIAPRAHRLARSEEHTSELQSRLHLVCRLLLEKKNKISSICVELLHCLS